MLVKILITFCTTLYDASARTWPTLGGGGLGSRGLALLLGPQALGPGVALCSVSRSNFA